MLTTFNRSEWKEDEAERMARMGLSQTDSPERKRQLFPLSGKLITGCNAYTMPAGQMFKYVRTKHIPSPYPFEALAWDRNGKATICQLTPKELQLMTPYEDA